VTSSAAFGFINAFKPPGPSSAAFGTWVKHVCGAEAVGHWGTLDPTACGVLVLAVGKATKLLPLLPHARKKYVFELVVGERTDTGDAKGAVIERMPVTEAWASALPGAASSLVGSLTQIPPMHSAVKIAGQPLYRLARKGQDVPRSPRATEIFELRIIAHDERMARLMIACEAGTYVRVVCEELGRRLGLPARMGALLRIASGPFELRESVTPQRIATDLAGCITNPLTILANPRIELDERAAWRFVHGNEVQLDHRGNGSLDTSDVQPATEVLVTRDGALVGCGLLVARDGTKMLAPTRVFAEH
jgi:tRNA pseudouridine55 synthase